MKIKDQGRSVFYSNQTLRAKDFYLEIQKPNLKATFKPSNNKTNSAAESDVIDHIAKVFHY